MIKKEILPSSQVKRQPPLNLNEGEERYFSHEYEKEIPATYWLDYNKVRLTEHGAVIKGFNIYTETLISPRDISSKKYLIKSYLKKTIKLNANEKYLMVFELWSHNYFHWICDAIPRLFVIKEKLKDFILLLPDSHKKEFIVETLKPFLLKDIIFFPKGSVVSVPKLNIPTLTSPTGNPHGVLCKKIRSFYFKNILSPLNDKSEKIYISRKKATIRFIVNEQAVIKLVEKYGFKVYHFEDFSFVQQVQIMYHSKYFISIHGAAITNIFFMKSHSSVLELRRKEDTHCNCYFALANALDLNYYYQLNDFEDYKPLPDGGFGNDYNLKINLKKLEENIKLMLK